MPTVCGPEVGPREGEGYFVGPVERRVISFSLSVWGVAFGLGEGPTGGEKGVSYICVGRDPSVVVDRVHCELTCPFVDDIDVLAPGMHSNVAWICARSWRYFPVHIGQGPGGRVDAVRPDGIRSIVCRVHKLPVRAECQTVHARVGEVGVILSDIGQSTVREHGEHGSALCVASERRCVDGVGRYFGGFDVDFVNTRACQC